MTRQATNQYTPNQVSSPGETLAEMLTLNNLTQSALSERMGRPKKTINEIIRGKASITPETALQLEKVFSVPASFWNNREKRYREYLARQAELESLTSQAAWLEEIPFREMMRFRWISNASDPLERLEILLAFFGVASPKQWRDLYRDVTFRKSPAFKSNPGAVAAWLRKGELEARTIECQPFDTQKFKTAVDEIRRSEITSLSKESVRAVLGRVVKRCAESGVATVFVRSLSNTRTFGASRWVSPDKAILQNSLLYKNDYSLWFTFFHEAGHILRHNKKEVFIASDIAGDEREHEANQFAEDRLFPNGCIQTFIAACRGRHITSRDIILFAKDLSLTPGVIVGKLQHDVVVPRNQLNGLKIRFTWNGSDTE